MLKCSKTYIFWNIQSDWRYYLISAKNCSLYLVFNFSPLSYVPYILSCSACLVPYVFSSITFLMSQVPCVLRALLTQLLLCISCSLCFVPLVNITFSILIFPCFARLLSCSFPAHEFFRQICYIKNKDNRYLINNSDTNPG